MFLRDEGPSESSLNGINTCFEETKRSCSSLDTVLNVRASALITCTAKLSAESKRRGPIAVLREERHLRTGGDSGVKKGNRASSNIMNEHPKGNELHRS